MPSGEYEEKLHCIFMPRDDPHLDIYTLRIKSGQYYIVLSILYPAQKIVKRRVYSVYHALLFNLWSKPKEDAGIRNYLKS